jgi:hypothetical protein
MPYLGNTPSTSFATVVKDSFSGDGSTVAFTLSKVATTNSVSVFVENVRQEPTTAYAVSGTTLTFTAAPVTSSGNNIYVLHMNPTTTTTHPSAQNLTAVNGTLTGTLAVTGTSTLTGNVTASADVSVGDDLSLASDGAVLGFGADNEITLTHVHNSGLRIEDEDVLYFGTDQDLSIQHTNSSNLQIIDASARLLIRAPRIDVQNGDGSETLFLGIDGGAFYAYHNNTQALETTSGGGVTVANGLTLTDGDVTVANGHGINFAASSTDGTSVASELLDDYEEGTWTPSASGATLSTAQGQYVKVGKLVTAHFNVVFPSSSDSSQTAVITSLPFASTGVNQYGGGFLSFEDAGDSGNQTIAMYGAATTYFSFVSGSTGLTLADASTHQFLGTLVYVASS